MEKFPEKIYVWGKPIKVRKRCGKGIKLLRLPDEAKPLLEKSILYLLACEVFAIVFLIEKYFFTRPYISLFLLILSITLYFNYKTFKLRL